MTVSLSVPDKAWGQLAGRLFSPAFLETVALDAHRGLIRELQLHEVLAHGPSVAGLLSSLYERMRKLYRNEYLYKNEIIRRIFESRHNPDRSTVLLERHIAGWASRIDMIIVNDTTTAYEIKTDRDDLSRIENQTASALTTFDRVIVVSSPRLADAVLERVDVRVGLIVLSEDDAFRRIRPPASNVDSVDPSAIFGLLRQSDYLPALCRHFGPLPTLDSVSVYDYCLGLFRKLSPRAAHAVLLSAFRRRYVCPGEADALRSAPYGLAHLYYKTPSSRRWKLFSGEILNRSIT